MVQRKVKGIYLWGSVGGWHSKASLAAATDPSPTAPPPCTPAALL